jgi:type III secretion system (T3SS) basal body protein I (YscI/HrpB/PscI-like)
MDNDLHWLIGTRGAGAAAPADSAADADDARTFAQALGDGHVMDMLSAFARDHAGQVRSIERGLLKAAKTGDPDRMLKLNRQYSAVMLEQAFATKVVGKAVQGIDAVTKLQ